MFRCVHDWQLPTVDTFYSKGFIPERQLKMFIRVLDRSADGSRWLTQCEVCGCALDWVTSLELTVMSVKGIKNLCFDCDPEADKIPRVMLLDGDVPEFIFYEELGRRYVVDTQQRRAWRVVASDENGKPMIYVDAKLSG